MTKILFALTLTSQLLFSFTLSSTVKRVNLLELFTSQGCSSCPPADRFVSSFVSKQDLFTTVVPVVFHVDYWDRLGWRDIFGSPAYTQKQYAYAKLWGNSGVYTPGFVLNGKEHRQWSHHIPYKNDQTGVLKLTIKDNKAHISFEASHIPSSKATVHLALMVMRQYTKINAGENNGKKLRSDFTVTNYQSTPSQINNKKLTATLSLQNFTKDKNKQYAISTWISDKRGDVIQAIGGYY